MLMKEMSNEHFTRSRKLELDTPVVVEESIRILAPSNISKTGKKKTLWCPAEMMSLFRTELDMEGKIKYKTLMSMAQVSKVPQATYCKRMNAFVAAHNYNSLAALKRDIPAAVRVTKFSHDYLIAGGWTQLRAEGRVCYLSPSEELAIAAGVFVFWHGAHFRDVPGMGSHDCGGGGSGEALYGQEILSRMVPTLP